jgi:hypothetical protein
MREAERQSIIQQAETEAQIPSQPEHAVPDTGVELTGISRGADELAVTIGEMRDRGLPVTPTEVEVAITGLRAITIRSNKAAWQLGLYAVEKELLSQAALAELLGVSTATVSRRFHEGLPEEHELSRTDVRSNPIR